MSTILLSLPDDELKTLQDYSQDHGEPLESWLAKQVHYITLKLRRQAELHPDVEKVIGVFDNDGGNWRDDLIQKHL